MKHTESKYTSKIVWLSDEHLSCALIWLISIELIILWAYCSGTDLLDFKKTWVTVNLDEGIDLTTVEIYTEQLRNFIGALVLFVGSFAGAITLGNAFKRTHIQDRESETNRDRHNSEVFSTAIGQLGSEKIATRLGAIYSLESLAREELSRKADGYLVEQTLETLASFIREQSKTEIQSYDPDNEEQLVGARVREDVEAAVSVLSRSYPNNRRPEILNSEGVNLEGAFLPNISLPEGADLRNFNMRNAVLVNAKLRQANLSSSILDSADLRYARLEFADMSDSFFRRAQLQSSKLALANLSNSEFFQANFDGSDLSQADVSSAIMSDVYGLTEEKIENLQWREGQRPILTHLV